MVKNSLFNNVIGVILSGLWIWTFRIMNDNFQRSFNICLVLYVLFSLKWEFQCLCPGRVNNSLCSRLGSSEEMIFWNQVPWKIWPSINFLHTQLSFWNKINKWPHTEIKLLKQPYTVIYNLPPGANEGENELQIRGSCCLYVNWKCCALALMGMLIPVSLYQWPEKLP